MFEALVQRLLNNILGQYIQDFSSQNLKIGIWSGQIILKNIALKKNIIKKFNLPFKIKYSRLGSLKMTISWKNIANSKIQVLLQGLQLVIAEIPISEWQCKNTKIIEQRKKQIQTLCQSIINDFAQKAQKQKQNNDASYTSKLIQKIIDNLQITIKDIHIRYQDQLTKQYSFGITLQEFKLYTVNDKGQPMYIDRNKPEYINQPLRKRLQLYNFGLYWNQKSQFYDEKYQQKMNSTIAKRGQINYKQNYILLMSFQAKLLQRQSGKQFILPQIDLQIDLENIKIEITNVQLQQIIQIGERLQQYTRKLRQQNRQILQPTQIRDNIQYFKSIFPKYYDGFGKNLSLEELSRIQSILEKMQVQNFTKIINKFLQEKQRDRIIKQRKQQNKGWGFWNKPKELTAAQLQQIQKYMNNNFGTQKKIIKRPQDFHYMKISFKMKKFQLVIANSLGIIRQGIKSDFDDLTINFSLRDGGYALDLSLEDIAVNMFERVGVQSNKYKPLLQKLQYESQGYKNSYVKLSVIGNPVDKKYLNIDIKMITSSLYIIFDPKIISFATDFSNLNVSKQNKQIAIQKYGQIKQITTNVVSQSIQKPKKSLIGLDIIIQSTTIAIPFSPYRQNQDCWALNLGNIHFTTDQQNLKKQVNDNIPLNVFNFQLTEFSFRHYHSASQLRQNLIKQIKYDNITHGIINDLNFKLRVELFTIATQVQSKMKIHAILPKLSINLCEYTYKNILKLGDAFEVEKRIQLSRQTIRISQKAQIQKKSSKIGFVYVKDNVTKIWKKYVAIMSENYIYLYINKTDKDYYGYYYIKGAKLQKYMEPLDKQKPYHFRIKNKVNEVVFGFDKQDQIQDWINKIKLVSKQQQLIMGDIFSAISRQMDIINTSNIQIKKDHYKLNLYVVVQIQQIGIRIYTTQSLQNQLIELYFTKLSSSILLYESKRNINLQLYSLQLKDTIKSYKNKKLIYFLQTKHIQNHDNLININIQQLNKDHPNYQNIQSTINISFGILSCNYKCQTIKKLMIFFIPPSSQQNIKENQVISQIDINTNSISINIDQNQQEIYSLKLYVKIQDISINLINQKINTMIGILGITKLDLYTGMSQKRMILKGSLNDLYYVDTTNYPYTIQQQQEQYPNHRYILTASIEDQNMLQFNIQILKQLNQNKKNMLIDVRLANITTYYVQQPVLRLITYLNTQMLPSFQTGPKQAKKIVPKDIKPQPSTMQLKVVLTNINAFVETQHQYVDKQKQQFLQLNIRQIVVQNDSLYKDYVKGKNKKKIILVENYLVKLYAMSIGLHYFDKNGGQHRYKITNNLDFTVSADMIANPEYYKRQLPDIFENGMRLSCSLTPFYMRLNQNDYNFIMKCLNWGITHNDGLDNILYDIPEQQKKEIQKKQIEKDSFYLIINMQCISLFVTDNNLPIAFLQLNKMYLDFNSVDNITQIKLLINNLYGTSIVYKKQQRILIQKGVFNILGNISKHDIQQIIDLQSFIKLFGKKQNLMDNRGQKIFLNFNMINTQKSTDINIDMGQFIIDIDINLLLILSTIANLDQKYIHGPQPIKIIEIKQVKQIKKINKKFTLLYKLNKLIGSISDQTNTKFMFIEGQIFFNMINYGDKTIEQLQILHNETKIQKSISHSSMTASLRQFSIYFSKIKDGKILGKRQFLQRMLIDFDQKKYYHYQRQKKRQNIKQLDKKQIDKKSKQKKIQKIKQQNIKQQQQKLNKKIHVLSTDIKLKTSPLQLTASLKDILNINKIIQDNLLILNKSSSSLQSNKQNIQLNNRQSKQIEKLIDIGQQIIKLQQKILNQIQPKTKIIGQIAPIHIQVINDCDNNFMPVIRLIIDSTQPLISQTLFTMELFIVPIINLSFFNQRSSRWQPIIQPFKMSVNYGTITINKQTNSTISIKTNSINQQTSSLKLNISTQMMSTVMAMIDIIKIQKQNIDKNIDNKQIQISPFIFYNLTNKKIYIIRKQNQFELNSLFKGAIRIQDQKQIIIKIDNKIFKFSTDHYGVISIPKTSYYVKFDTEKLNKIIKFIPNLYMINHLDQSIYIKIIGLNNDIPRKVQKNQEIPLDGVEQIAVSLNGQSYTQMTLVRSFKLGSGVLVAEKKNFIILSRYNERPNKCDYVQLIPPFQIHNCLPKNVNIQFIQKAKTKSTISINSQHSYSIFTSEDINTLQLKISVIGYTWSKKFKYNRQRGEQLDIQLSDEGDNIIILNYIFNKNRYGQYELIIYCRKIIINELFDKLLVYGNLQYEQKQNKKDYYKLLGGQRRNDDLFDDKIIMVGKQIGNKIRVCGSHSVVDFATPINIGGLGSSQSRIVVDRSYNGKKDSLFTVIDVQISAMKMTKNCDIFCKKIILKNKSIIINTTDKDIIIKQQLALKYQFISQAGSKKSFVFGMPDIQGRHYRYRIYIKNYRQSRLIYLPTQGKIYFKLQNQNQLDQNGKNKIIYFKIYVTQNQSYNFYQISQINQQQFPYQIIVKSQALKVNIPSIHKIARKGELVRFINQNQDQNQHIIDLHISHAQSKQQSVVKVRPDDLKYYNKQLLKVERGGLTGSIAIVVKVTISDKQKQIIIDELTRTQQIKQIPQSTLSLDIAQIILSISHNSQTIQNPYESIVLTLRRLLFIKYETDKKIQYQLKLGYFQIDQSYPHILSNPVILTPYRYIQFTRQQNPRSIFNFIIILNKQFIKNTFINEISVDFDDIVAIFSADFINLITFISKQFGQVINYKQQTYFIDKKIQKWKDIILPPQNKNIFIKSIKIAPFTIDLTAQLNIKKLDIQNNVLLETILSSIGGVMSNIDRAPIDMTGIQINDFIDTSSSITNKLISHYKQICIKQFYKIFGSLNIIGNPISLFRNISTGVRDLKDKPAQGFVKGPAEFGLGIVEGTGSLVAHSVGGAFNSISKVTGTVSTGLAALAFDEQFEEHREKQKMKKPQNVIQGLSKGGKAIFHGFKQGITGVFTQPIENAKKQGALGFVKGAAKGLAGLVVKPVTGIIDFASKTTQGIKNNALMFEDKARQQRMRYPRVFYSQCFIMKQYSWRDGLLYSILRKIQNESKFNNPIFVDAQQIQNDKLYLTILTSGIALLDIQSHKLKWSINYSDLEMNNKKKKLIFKDKSKQTSLFSSNEFDIMIENDEIRGIVGDLIISLKQGNY